MFQFIKIQYILKRITEEQLEMYVIKGYISEEEKNLILGV